MRRTQLYLPEEMWQALHAQAKISRVTISELVREAVKVRYLAKSGRKEAMLRVVGMWSDREEMEDSEAYIRELRTDNRLERIFSDSDID